MSFLQLERRGLFIHLQSLQLLLKGVKERVNDGAINHTRAIIRTRQPRNQVYVPNDGRTFETR